MAALRETEMVSLSLLLSVTVSDMASAGGGLLVGFREKEEEREKNDKAKPRSYQPD